MQLPNFNSHTREGVTGHSGLSIGFVIFQLTHPWGCDTIIAVIDNEKIISTHTPVRVWLYCVDRGSKRGKFQLTHPWGCDINIHFQKMRTRKFQLTHPWGCDWKTTCCSQMYSLYFNSHTREGVTGKCTFIAVINKFQLTHPWGCDILNDGLLNDNSDFNSHTREGVTFGMRW